VRLRVAEVKVCVRCDKAKPLSEFHRRASGSRDGRRTECGPCVLERDRASKHRYEAANPTRQQTLRRCQYLTLWKARRTLARSIERAEELYA
jgi:hypothetical protein